MAPFEELQQLWRRQPEGAIPSADAAKLSHAFRRYGRRHDLIYLVKGIFIAAQLTFLIVQLRHRPLASFGACLADFSALLFLISDWRTQRSIARMNFTEPSVEFLRSVLARLEAQRNPFRSREFYIAMAGCWIGCNLIVASYWAEMNVTAVLPAFALIAAAPFAAYALARKIRTRRFERECRPLIERLESVLNTMEENR